jgi:hypothetical protein
MTFTRYFVIHVKRRKVRRMNDYAEQFGYKNELDFVYDYGNVDDLSNIIDNTIKVCIKRSPKDAVNGFKILNKHLRNAIDELMNEISATHIIDDVVNEIVSEIVDDDINLKNEVRRD